MQKRYSPDWKQVTKEIPAAMAEAKEVMTVAKELPAAMAAAKEVMARAKETAASVHFPNSFPGFGNVGSSPQ